VSPVRSVQAVRITAIVACTFGTIVLAWQFFGYLKIFPAPSLLAAGLELPLLLAGFVLLRLARPVRPPGLIWAGAAVTWGGTAAAGCALLANQGLASLWAKGAGSRFASTWSAPLSAPLNEELLKLCGVLMIVLAAPVMIRGPLDGWIYGALTGLGFQVVENVTYGLNSISLSGATDPADAVTNSFVVRVGQAGLGSHWTMTAVAGAGLGFIVLRVRGSDRGSVQKGAACIAAAVIMHLQFDAPYLPLFLKVIINFLLAGGLYLVLSNAYLDRARAALAASVAGSLATPDEAAGVLSRVQRRRQLWRLPAGRERELARARQQVLLAHIDAEAEWPATPVLATEPGDQPVG
jgi:RsiW-degrading membrane proteinase PrsW (M82 family)